MFKTFLTTAIAGFLATMVIAAPAPQQDELREPDQEERRAEQDRPQGGDRETDRQRDQERRRDTERADERESDSNREREAEARQRNQKRQAAEQHERAIADLRRRLEELHHVHEELQGKDGEEERLYRIGQQIRETEWRLAELTHRDSVDEHGDHHDPDQHRGAMQRLEHMMIAAEHLDHAGMQDMAHAIRRRAEELERDLGDHAHGPEREGEQHAREGEQHAREREQHAREREQHARERDEHARERDEQVREMMEQLNAMRREMESLREQMGQLREDR